MRRSRRWVQYLRNTERPQLYYESSQKWLKHQSNSAGAQVIHSYTCMRSEFMIQNSEVRIQD